MTNSELSNEFDVLYNNVTSNQAPGLDEYEKSVFLTKAQDEVIEALFNPRLNKPQEGFDDSPIRQADFSTIIKSCDLTPIQSSLFDVRATAFELPEDLFLSLNEQLTSYADGTRTPYTVVPISYTEYNRLMQKPYKYPCKYQVWRLITQNATVAASATSATGYYGTSLAGEFTSTTALTTVSDYGKPVRLIVNIVSTASTVYGDPPTAVETEQLVTITCNVMQGIKSSNYWGAFLYGDSAIKLSIDKGGIDITTYLKEFSGQSGYSVWPSFTAAELSEGSFTMFDITNAGGTSTHSAVVAEIIGRFTSSDLSYKIRYIKKLKPIILVDLEDIDNSLSIKGETSVMSCELPPSTHPIILQRAVEMAKAAYTGDLNSQLALGTQSQTNVGMVTSSR